jgi:2-polyprenyl-3-methyl-5-hydroxy-6-metoxy-1,4-benzoquinol methylase
VAKQSTSASIPELAESRTSEAKWPACKLCGKETTAFLERASVQIVRCESCRFMFAVMPDQFSAGAQYIDDTYFSPAATHGISDYDSLWNDLLSHLYVPRLGRMLELGGRGGRHLDVGCASGNLIEHARKMGWECFGVELSDAMRGRAEQRTGRPIFASLAEAKDSGLRFDSVTMFEVIEHVEDPAAVMREVAELILPGGMIALSTPNFDNPNAVAGTPIDIWFIPPEHISYFNRETIAACMQNAGLSPVAKDGIFGAWRACAGDTSFPPWLTATLRPWRKNKRLRPGGLLGSILKRTYSPARRPELYRRRGPDDLKDAEVLEIYARRVEPAE